MKQNFLLLEQLANLIRSYILTSTTNAKSGHPTSSLSAVELMAGLFFGGIFQAKLSEPDYCNNDRLIFSKGHAAPLLYSLYCAAGAIPSKELMTLRKFGSRLEGHPSTIFPWCEVPTGSLGQGLSVGVGMALNAKYLDKLPYKTYVLLGDSELSEGSQWEAMQIAAHYKLDNLIGILDVNRLGQRGETMYGSKLKEYEKRIRAFGWQTICIDGHSFGEIVDAYKKAQENKNCPTMIIAKTIKGKGVDFLEDKEGWHGKALSGEDLKNALAQLGEIKLGLKGQVLKPKAARVARLQSCDASRPVQYQLGEKVSTRQAYGNALLKIAQQDDSVVVLDAETSNSTYAEVLKKFCAKRFFEMYIAEQNMVGVASGLARRNKKPFVSTFAAFLSRAHDQIRMAQYADANIVLAGSHAGVSIGADGPSQMGLEDIAMFRALLGSKVLYPCDAIATEKLANEAAQQKGITYLRLTRDAVPVIYKQSEKFFVGGSKVLRESSRDQITVVAAGITVFEALTAYEELKKQGITIRVLDLYSVKPLDIKTLQNAAKQTKAIVVVEDHFAEGGIGEAVCAALACEKISVHVLAVQKTPKSGTATELLEYENISKNAIVHTVKKLI